jgi:hypothetical protein
MGNYNFKVQKPPVSGSIVQICHNEYSKTEKIDPMILKVGARAKVIKNITLYQSRPNFPEVNVTVVQIQGSNVPEAHLTTNLTAAQRS